MIFALLRTGQKYALALESPPPASCRSKSPRDTNPSDPTCLRGQPRQASSLGAGVNYGGDLFVAAEERQTRKGVYSPVQRNRLSKHENVPGGGGAADHPAAPPCNRAGDLF